MKRTWIVGVAVACLSLAACGSSGNSASKTDATSGESVSSSSSSATKPTGSPYVLGQIGSFSGALAESFAQKKSALTAWADWTNDNGGINGHPVELIQVDDQGDPAKSIAGVHKLVETDKVLAIVDSSFVDEAWSKYVQQQKVPVVGDALFNDATFGASGMDYFFPQGTTNAEIIYGAMAATAKMGSTKLGLFCMTVVPACAIIPNFMRTNAPKAGAKLVYSAGVDAASPNYTAQCLGAKSAGVQALYIAGVPAIIDKALANCKTQGGNFKYMSTLFAVNSNQLSQSDFNGWVISSPAVPLVSSSPAAQQFLNAMKKYQPNVSGVGGQAQITWNSGLLFAAAAKAGKLGDNPTREQLVNGLYSFKGETLGGAAPPLTYTRGEGHRITCYFVEQIEGGKFTAPDGLTPQCAPADVAS